MVCREVWLEDEQDQRLGEIAGRSGTTPAAIIQAAVDDLLRREFSESADRDEALTLLEQDMLARASEGHAREAPWYFDREGTYD